VSGEILYDISPPVTSDLAVWPGDTPLSREVLLDMAKGDNLTLSTLHATVHLGAHVDAASHYGADAPSVEAWPPERFVGPCEVLRLSVDRGVRIGPEALPETLRANRVLLATGTFPDPTRFNEDFAALAPELVEQLASRGVELVGIDTPSVDLFASRDLEAHRACLQHDVAILEGLVLDRVPPGVYELIALPLRLVGFDASPVRAVLREV
jgi:arylformamidase